MSNRPSHAPPAIASVNQGVSARTNKRHHHLAIFAGMNFLFSFWLRRIDEGPSSPRSSTQPRTQWRMYVGHLHARRARAHLAGWGTVSGCRTVRHSECRSSSFGLPPPPFGLCDSGSSPVPSGNRFPLLHQATGVRRYTVASRRPCPVFAPAPSSSRTAGARAGGGVVYLNSMIRG